MHDFNAGTGLLVRLHAKINATVSKDMLKKRVVTNLRTAINQPAVFMQERAPCHTAKSGMLVMKWPAQNPNMNPIENIWKVLRLYTHMQMHANDTIKTSHTVLRKIYLSLYLKGLCVRGSWRPNRTATY